MSLRMAGAENGFTLKEKNVMAQPIPKFGLFSHVSMDPNIIDILASHHVPSRTSGVVGPYIGGPGTLLLAVQQNIILPRPGWGSVPTVKTSFSSQYMVEHLLKNCSHVCSKGKYVQVHDLGLRKP